MLDTFLLTGSYGFSPLFYNKLYYIDWFSDAKPILCSFIYGVIVLFLHCVIWIVSALLGIFAFILMRHATLDFYFLLMSFLTSLNELESASYYFLEEFVNNWC
jgi:hypothetical protein